MNSSHTKHIEAFSKKLSVVLVDVAVAAKNTPDNVPIPRVLTEMEKLFSESLASIEAEALEKARKLIEENIPEVTEREIMLMDRSKRVMAEQHNAKRKYILSKLSLSTQDCSCYWDEDKAELAPGQVLTSSEFACGCEWKFGKQTKWCAKCPRDKREGKGA